MLQLGLWFVERWGRGREMVMCSPVRVMVCYRLGRRRELVMCATISVMIFYEVG